MNTESDVLAALGSGPKDTKQLAPSRGYSGNLSYDVSLLYRMWDKRLIVWDWGIERWRLP